MRHDLAADIKVGDHITAKIFGLTLNVDTIWTSAIAGVIVILLGLALRSQVTSGVPGRLQLFWEAIVGGLQDQVEANMGKVAPYVVPLSVSIFVFILVANWLGLIPTHEYLKSPSADVNFTYALALLVIIWVHVAGARKAGVGKYLKHLVFPPGRWFMAPINIIEEIVRPFSLALRLFGNILAGGIMISVIGLLPYLVAPTLGDIAWKLFDMFIGLIQAFIFALLTILYFGFAFEPAGEGEH